MKLYNYKKHDKAWLMTSASETTKPHVFFEKQSLIKVPRGSRLMDYPQDEATVMALDVSRKNRGKNSAKINKYRGDEETKSHLPMSEAYDTMSSSDHSEMSKVTTKTGSGVLDKHCILGDCNG